MFSQLLEGGLTEISFMMFERHVLHTFVLAIIKVIAYNRQNYPCALFKRGQMNRQDRTTQTDGQQRRYRTVYGLTVKDVLKLISSLILPLVLGIFTVISASNQQKEVMRQQERDGILRRQEVDIANKQNDLQQQMTIRRYQDELLVAYTKDTSELLERHNGSLTSSSLIAALARAKAFSTIRQLDGSRNSLIIRFLYEAGQLTTTNESSALDISTLELDNVNKSVFKTVSKIGTLSLAGALLRNCTINHTSLCNIDFSSTELDEIDFSSSELNCVQFQSGQLENVNFASATLRYALLHLSFKK